MTGTSLRLSSTSLNKTPEELAAQFALLTTFESVAAILEITPYQLYHFTHAGHRYTNLAIKKKHGGVRAIRAPIVGLKIIQSKLNQILRAVYEVVTKLNSEVVEGGRCSSSRFQDLRSCFRRDAL